MLVTKYRVKCCVVMCLLSTLVVCPNYNNPVQVTALIFLAALLWKYWRSYPTVLVSTKANSISVMTVYYLHFR